MFTSDVDVWDFFHGYVDGVFNETGPTDQMGQCIGNLSRAQEVYYNSFSALIYNNDQSLWSRWLMENSFRSLFVATKDVFQWPFLTL